MRIPQFKAVLRKKGNSIMITVPHQYIKDYDMTIGDVVRVSVDF